MCAKIQKNICICKYYIIVISTFLARSILFLGNYPTEQRKPLRVAKKRLFFEFSQYSYNCGGACIVRVKQPLIDEFLSYIFVECRNEKTTTHL